MSPRTSRKKHIRKHRRISAATTLKNGANIRHSKKSARNERVVLCARARPTLKKLKMVVEAMARGGVASPTAMTGAGPAREWGRAPTNRVRLRRRLGRGTTIKSRIVINRWN